MEKFIEEKLNKKVSENFNRYDLITKYIDKNKLINVSLKNEYIIKVLCDNPVKHALELVKIIYLETCEKYLTEEKLLNENTIIKYKFEPLVLFLYNPTFDKININLKYIYKELFILEFLLDPIVNFTILNTLKDKLQNTTKELRDINFVVKNDNKLFKNLKLKYFMIDNNSIVIKTENEQEMLKFIGDKKYKRYTNMLFTKEPYYNIEGNFIFVSMFNCVPFNNITRLYYLLQKSFILEQMNKNIDKLFKTINFIRNNLNFEKELLETKEYLRDIPISKSRELNIQRLVNKTIKFHKFIPYNNIECLKK